MTDVRVLSLKLGDDIPQELSVAVSALSINDENWGTVEEYHNRDGVEIDIKRVRNLFNYRVWASTSGKIVTHWKNRSRLESHTGEILIVSSDRQNATLYVGSFVDNSLTRPLTVFATQYYLYHTDHARKMFGVEVLSPSIHEDSFQYPSSQTPESAKTWSEFLQLTHTNICV